MTMQDSSSVVEDMPATMAEGVASGKKKVVVIGAGWAGLAAAYELSKQVSAWRGPVCSVLMYNAMHRRHA